MTYPVDWEEPPEPRDPIDLGLEPATDLLDAEPELRRCPVCDTVIPVDDRCSCEPYMSVTACHRYRPITRGPWAAKARCRDCGWNRTWHT